MKLKKLLQDAETLLNTKKSKLISKKKELRKLVRQLRVKEKSLEQELEAESEKEKRKKLKNKVALAHSQRKKALKALKSLKQNKD